MADLARRARDLLSQSRGDASNLVASMGMRQARELMVAAQKDLQRRLKAVKPGMDGSFQQAQLRASLEQVRLVLGSLRPKMQGLVLDVGEQAATKSAQNSLAYLQTADKLFRGVGEAPMAIREASYFDAATQGARSSILHRLASSGESEEGADEKPHRAKLGVLDRYGLETIDHFEKVFRVGMIAKKSAREMRDDITEQSDFLRGAPAYWATRIVRTECLLGDTPVSAVVRAVFRRWYEGDVFEVVTEAGRKFTATPNHPMLTRRGWVGAGLLQEGDDLVCNDGEQNHLASSNQDVERRPTPIAEVFNSLAAVRVAERRSGSQPDFHGDGFESEVDVLRPDGLLRVGNFSTLREPSGKDVFAPSDFSRPRFCCRCRSLLSNLSRDQSGSFGGGTSAQAGGSQDTHDGAIGNVQRSRDLFDGDPFGELRNNFLLGQRLDEPRMSKRGKAIQRRISPSAYCSDCAEVTLQSMRTNVVSQRGVFNARTVDVKFDRVVNSRRLPFAGHVYNLETPYGYFAINGAYTGNCAGAYNRAGYEAIRESNEQLGDMLKIQSAVFDDRTAADSYSTHGQIREPEEPFDTWYGPMQHPPDRPLDRGLVVPHRKSWAWPAYLNWRTDDEVADRWKWEGRKGEPPERPLMTTVDLDDLIGIPPEMYDIQS